MCDIVSVDVVFRCFFGMVVMLVCMILIEYVLRLSVIVRIVVVYLLMCMLSVGKLKKMKNSWMMNGVL